MVQTRISKTSNYKNVNIRIKLVSLRKHLLSNKELLLLLQRRNRIRRDIQQISNDLRRCKGEPLSGAKVDVFGRLEEFQEDQRLRGGEVEDIVSI